VEVAFGKVKNMVEEAECLTSAVLVHVLALVGVLLRRPRIKISVKKSSHLARVVPKRLIKHGAAVG